MDRAPVRVRLLVNGDSREVDAGVSVAELVAELVPESGGSARWVAVERNDEIVPRAAWSATRLRPGDRIEIVRFVQGG